MGLTLKWSISACNRINIGIIHMVTLVAEADLELLNNRVITDYYTGYEAHDAIIVHSLKILLEPALLSKVFEGSEFTGEGRT